MTNITTTAWTTPITLTATIDKKNAEKSGETRDNNKKNL